MSLLEVSGLRCGYGIVEVLFGLDLSVGEGELVVVLGANGAGKTTTLRDLGDAARGGLGSPGRPGGARAAPRPAAQGRHGSRPPGTRHDLAAERRGQPQGRRLPTLRVGGGGGPRHVAGGLPRLAERRNQQAGSMSGGEQQMLAIARAFMSRPRLLLLDEPSLGLAPLVTREVFDRLREVTEQVGLRCCWWSRTRTWPSTSRRAYVLEAGSIVASGPAAELQGDEAIQKAYLGL
ncbi:MAG: ATP-binding cassette domain-containing protein [Microthrixaceae bacterium]